jgi:hypothetical protein
LLLAVVREFKSHAGCNIAGECQASTVETDNAQRLV